MNRSSHRSSPQPTGGFGRIQQLLAVLFRNQAGLGDV